MGWVLKQQTFLSHSPGGKATAESGLGEAPFPQVAAFRRVLTQHFLVYARGQ